ncbi:MAG: tetratricopeptide repeat protein [Acidobacteriia bacterium]|nr:tetratricopeptide repeat protein [Terriglobia bacterium]
MRLRVTLVAVAVFSMSCVRQTSVAKAPAAPQQAAQSVWERQIRNAKDAGDGDYQLRVLREKVAADSESIPARLELAKAYQERGYPDVSLEICRLTAGRFPASGEAQLALVRALRGVNRRNEAIQGLEAFLEQHPQMSPDYYSWLGILRDESELWTEGEAAHRKALEISPADDSLHNNLGYNLLMQKKNDAAAAEFREALKRNPRSPVAHNNLGLALANQNATGEAVATWQSAAGAAVAHNNLAAVLIEKGNYPAARKELEISLDYNRSLPAALRNLELVSRLDGNPALFHVKQGDGPPFPVKQDQTGWERWKASFKKLFVGPLDNSRKDPDKTASAPASGEER